MFCVICFEDCDFLFRRRDKEIYSKCADAETEKERVQRDKNGNMNNVAFYAVSSSSPHRYLCPKLKTRKSKRRSHQFQTENTKHLYIRSILKEISDVVTLGTFCYRDQSFINRRGVGYFYTEGEVRNQTPLTHKASRKKSDPL